MMREMGMPATTLEVARHYVGRATHFVIDEVDAAAEGAVRALGFETLVAQTVMATLQDRIDLARTVLEFVN